MTLFNDAVLKKESLPSSSVVYEASWEVPRSLPGFKTEI